VFDAILFDNDGVLVDTEPLYFRANQETLAGVGIDLDAATYVELVDGADVLIPGVADIVPALARRYRLAIVTSSEPAPFARAHARTGLLDHFEVVLKQGDYGRAKPEPDPYLRAVERLGVAGERCLVIEDSERGLRAAKAAGLRCWVIPSALTAGGRFDAADAVLDGLGAAAARLLG